MSVLDAAIAATPHACARMLVHRDAVVVNYHLVAPDAPKHITGILPHKTPEQFEQDLRFLKRYYTVVSYAKLLASRNGGPPLPRHAMLITFDDGFRECYEYVRPLLLKHAVPCTFFLITDSIGNRALAYPNRTALCLDIIRSCADAAIARAHSRVREMNGKYFGDSREALYQAVRALTALEVDVLDTVEDALGIDKDAYLRDQSPYLTAKQIGEMQQDGFTFGAHTLTHPQLWLLDEERLELEIAESCKAVCELTGDAAAPFAFPYRSNGLARATLAAIRERNPHVGMMFDTHGYVRDAAFMAPRLSFDDPAGSTPAHSNLREGLNRGYIAQAAKTLLGRGAMA